VVNLAILITAFLISFLVTPLVRKFSLRHSILDEPEVRKVHPEAVPTLGGVAIYVASLTGIVLGGLWGKFTVIDIESILGIVLGGGVILCLGIYDDVKRSSVALKLIFQAAAAAILFQYGYRITSIANPFGGSIELTYLSLPITMLWVMVFTNALNLIDGVDGLAAGIASISSTTFFLTGLILGNPKASLVSLSVLGASAGFLRHNFCPAKVFMGDTGSMFLGFILSAIAILGAGKTVALIALLIPILAVGVPLVDTLLAVFRRSKLRQGIFNADRSHIHHRLLDLGFSARQVVLILYMAAILLGIVAVALSTANRGIVLVFIGFSVVGFLVLVSMVRVRR